MGSSAHALAVSVHTAPAKIPLPHARIQTPVRAAVRQWVLARLAAAEAAAQVRRWARAHSAVAAAARQWEPARSAAVAADADKRFRDGIKNIS